MRLSLSMKVGLVFSCLALLLGLFSATGMASAHTANTLQTAHVSAVALANDGGPGPNGGIEQGGFGSNPGQGQPPRYCPPTTQSTDCSTDPGFPAVHVYIRKVR